MYNLNCKYRGFLSDITLQSTHILLTLSLWQCAVFRVVNILYWFILGMLIISFLVFFFLILLMNNGNYGVINERNCMEIEKRDTGIQGVCPKRIFTENDAQTIKNI